jgi:hypothetical protein
MIDGVREKMRNEEDGHEENSKEKITLAYGGCNYPPFLGFIPHGVYK